jgi:4-amino-4-deoxy-L-arabinose transferase-like glycosyltransferase
LYWATAARDIVLGDTPELITAAVTVGIPHAPGYPLVTMLGHLFSLLPAGSPAFRVDLLSVACGTATVTIVYLTALRLSRSRVASACSALLLAFSPLFWAWSLVAEVFSPNNLLAAVFIYLLVVWYQQPERLELLAGAAFVSGLAFTNQQTIVLLGPATLFLLWNRRRVLLARPARLAAVAGAFAAGLLPYCYLPWAAARHPVMNFGDPSTFSNFMAVITRKHFGTGQLINSPKYMGGSPLDRIIAMGASFTVPMAVLSVLGLVQAYRRRRWYFWFSAIALAFTGPIFVAYANINLSVPLTRFVLERFYLLSHVVIAPLMSFGVLLAAELLLAAVPALRTRATAAAASAAMVAVLAGIIVHYREIDQSNNHAARQFGEDIFATLEPGAILVANGDEAINPLVYLQAVEGNRPDVAVLEFPLLPTDWYLDQLRRRYPTLVIPFDHFDGQSGSLKALVEANPNRPMAVIGVDSDDSLKGNHWFYRRGLVSVVEPMSRDVKLDEMMADNGRLLGGYKPPLPTDIKSNSLEVTFLSHYATPAVVVAGQCEQLGYYRDARAWYERALSINPSLSEIRTALARLPAQ